jgi:CheY-like chemotaxis protein
MDVMLKAKVVNIVVSDIDMPRMKSFHPTENIRSDKMRDITQA